MYYNIIQSGVDMMAACDDLVIWDNMSYNIIQSGVDMMAACDD
jgi:hypothetical protein